jgi:hypothetical protein
MDSQPYTSSISNYCRLTSSMSPMQTFHGQFGNINFTRNGLIPLKSDEISFDS